MDVYNAMETGVPAGNRARSVGPSVGPTCKTVNNATARHNAKKVKDSLSSGHVLHVLLLRHSSRLPDIFAGKEGTSKQRSSAVLSYKEVLFSSP